MRLLLLLIVTPIVELFLLFQLSEVTGWGFTILLTVVTGVVGSNLARQQGWKTFARIQEEFSQGQMPTDSLIDAFMILAAGLLLMTPGILTDCLGFSLLIPACRRVYRRWLIGWFKRNVTVQTFKNQPFDRQFHGPSGDGRDQIVDSYVVESRSDDPSNSIGRDQED